MPVKERVNRLEATVRFAQLVNQDQFVMTITVRIPKRMSVKEHLAYQNFLFAIKRIKSLYGGSPSGSSQG